MEDIREKRPEPAITVLVQPENEERVLPRPKTAGQLLSALGLRACTALVARDGELLTHDRAILPGDRILVRKVTSSG